MAGVYIKKEKSVDGKEYFKHEFEFKEDSKDQIFEIKNLKVAAEILVNGVSLTSSQFNQESKEQIEILDELDRGDIVTVFYKK